MGLLLLFFLQKRGPWVAYVHVPHHYIVPVLFIAKPEINDIEEVKFTFSVRAFLRATVRKNRPKS